MNTYNLSTALIKKHLRNGKYYWPGGYPAYFVTSDGAALSFEAVKDNWWLVCYSVRNNLNDGWQVAGVDINWEDSNLYCDHTGDRIESAYGDDND